MKTVPGRVSAAASLLRACFGSPRTRITILIFLIAAAFSLRLLFIQKAVIDKPMRGDAMEYVMYAINLVASGTYSSDLPPRRDFGDWKPEPDSFRPPGYPWLIYAVMKIGGERTWSSNLPLIQVLLSTALVPLTYALGAALAGGAAGLLAAALVALSPHLISATAYYLTETLFAFSLLSSLALFYLALKRKSLWVGAGCGILFGYSYLVNETALFIPILLCLAVVVLSGRDSGQKGLLDNPLRSPYLKTAAVVLAVFILFPAGWMGRNALNVPPHKASGRDRALATLTHGSYPGFFYKSDPYRFIPYREDPQAEEYASSLSSFARIFSERFRERPLRYLSWYFLEKPYYLWSWNILQGGWDVNIYPVLRSLYVTQPIAGLPGVTGMDRTISNIANTARVFMKVLHPLILILTLAGLILFGVALFRNRSLHPEDSPFAIFAVIAYYTLLYSVFASWPRYSIPLRPELYLAAVWTLNEFSHGLARRRKTPGRETGGS